MKAALFRVDGSHHLGMGHLMRCLAFAQGLSQIELKSIFVIKDFGEKLAELVNSYGFNIEIMPHETKIADDAKWTVEIATRYNAGLLITDLSNSDTLRNLEEISKYFRTLKDTDKFLIILDGLGEDCVSSKVFMACDILVVPYLEAEKGVYKVDCRTKLLAGMDYFIFRKEFITSAKYKRVIKQNARNILVITGGSDPCDLTLLVARALNKLEVKNLCLRLVIGPGFAPLAEGEVREILGNFKGQFELIEGSINIADLMLWCDLAITGSGLTKYEMAVTGTPGIIISQSVTELDKGKEFEKIGSAEHLDLVNRPDEKSITDTIERILGDYILRTEMSANGKQILDGKGIERIIAQIPVYVRR